MLDPAELAAAFMSEVRGVVALDPVTLGAQLCAAVDAAVQERGSSSISAVEFVRFLAERIPQKDVVDVALKGLHLGDLYLACACLRGDSQAIERLRELLVSEVRSDIRRVDPLSDFVHEVEQLVALKLLVAEPEKRPKLHDYSGRGPLGAWLRAIALGTALNVRRQRKDFAPIEGGEDDPIEQLPLLAPETS